MEDGSAHLDWSEETWNRVRQVVYDEAQKSRVAGTFLPLFGPLPKGTAQVSKMRLSDLPLSNPQRGEAAERMEVDDVATVPLATIAVDVYLKSVQTRDPELGAGIIMFQRAANIVARVEDAIIFNGQPGPGQGPLGPSVTIPPIYHVTGGSHTEGLLSGAIQVHVEDFGKASSGNALVGAVASAIAKLEGYGHLGPFACVLDDEYFTQVCTPDAQSLVLPKDRILPFLNGPLLRSSTLPKTRGVVVSLSGAPIDLVVGDDISVKLLQVSVEPRFVFRVSQRIVLRIKQNSAIAVLLP